MNQRLAIVLFNLGGPDRPEAVEPFLRNLFSDPAIIGAPGFVRLPLARYIARKRAPKARAIYEEMGGGSPLLPNTKAQGEALSAVLAGRLSGWDLQVSIAMRYWHPLTEAAAAEVAAFKPDRIILLPLYPQYSTTTTGSSFAAWHKAAKAVGLSGVPSAAICCYPHQQGFVREMAALIRPRWQEARESGAARLLFSAHGLPKKVIAKGDPYQWQVEQTAAAVAQALGLADQDWQVCYQSRVGPLEWIGPATEAEITRAGVAGCAVVLAPIAFVSEHSETLVELDIEYAHLAREKGVPLYLRVPTAGCGAAFIDGLAELVVAGVNRPGVASENGGRICPKNWARCALETTR